MWKGAEDQIAHLDAVRRKDITKEDVVLADNLREIVHDDKQDTKRSLKNVEVEKQTQVPNTTFESILAFPDCEDMVRGT